MDRKVVTEIILTLLFTGMLGSVFNVGVDGTIYIRSDGSVDPPTAPIKRVGDTYTFTGNIYHSIVVERDNIIIDGGGYTLQGRKKVWNVYGLDLSHRSNETVKNCKITGFESGIFLYGSNGNSLLGNSVSNSDKGIVLFYSSNNVLRNNSMFDNWFNFGVFGFALSDFVQDIDTSNNVNGKPIYYWLNQRDSQIPTDAGCVAVINSTNITVKNLNLLYNLQSVLLAYTVNSTIQGNTALKHRHSGIALYSSNYNTISNNTASENWDSGIALYSSNYNTISNNTASENWDSGIALYSSNYNTVYHNNIIKNAIQAYDDGTNTWDNGAEGNYWSDYNGVDLFSGPYQNVTGSDGIGDSPYIIDENNVDNYPLMSPHWYWSNPILGDVNRDMKVDMKDIGLPCTTFGSYTGHPRWNPLADVDKNNVIEMRDIGLICINFGKTYP